MDRKEFEPSTARMRTERATAAVLKKVGEPLFVAFFGPICFTDISPVKAIVLAAMPALSLSWGWIVLLRSLFRKRDFCR